MTETPRTAGPATIRIGFKNVLGSNWAHRGYSWRSRVPSLRRELLGPDGLHASVYLFVEVKGRRERSSLAELLPGWELAKTRGKNKAYSDPSEHRLVESHEFTLGSTTRQRRKVTIADYEHLATGITWTAAVTHLSSSGGTTPAAAAASRSAEAAALVRLCAQHGVDVIAADLNNSAALPGTPRAVLQAAGFRDWRSVLAVENVDYDSHYPFGTVNPRTGKHLDAFYFGPRVTALDGRLQVTEPHSSDHVGLACTISIQP